MASPCLNLRGAIRWQDVWPSFDKRRNAKAGEGANDVAVAEAAAANEPELFGQPIAPGCTVTCVMDSCG